MDDSRTIPVSVIVMTKNEERNIAQCLGALSAFEEVFVVDSGSTDKTVRIAEDYGAKIATFEWTGGYPKKKQWALEHLPFTHDWVLYVDADEFLTEALTAELLHLFRTGPKCAGYFVTYEYVFLGRVLRHGHRVKKLVLIDRNKSKWVEWNDLDANNMWEVEGHYQPVVSGPLGTLRAPMVHRDHDSLFHYFARHNRYSDWEAVVRTTGAVTAGAESQQRFNQALKRVFTALPAKGAIVFVHSYILRAGYRDGWEGLHFALARAFYYWQTDLKIRERKQRQTYIAG